jgi:membrane-bound serine protease (ClpP class)
VFRRAVRGIGLTCLTLGLAVLLLAHWPAPANAQSPHVSLVPIDGAIDAINARYLARAINRATDDGAVLIVVQLDTPGGRLDSTRDMVEAILASPVPLAVYVSPSGAQAASAGTFVTAAANFAVMAPVTNIGAASPISGSGEDLPDTLARKVNQDTQAFIRGIAEQRGRNAQALEDTVTKALAYSASEAIDLGIVDLIATDIPHLLAQLDGRTAETAAGPVVLSTTNLPVREIKKTLVESFLTVIADPNIAFLLLSIGSLSLMAEFFSPGVFGPGIVGVLALALAWVSLGLLPVNWVAVALILFSMGLFYFELQVAGVGAFGAGGVAAFLVGSFLLFGGFFQSSQIPEPTVEVSRWLIGAMTMVAITVLLSVFFLMRDSGAVNAYVNASDAALIGEHGVALTNLAPSGTVRIGDRKWSATIEEGGRVRRGEDVRVIGVYSGDVLKVSAVPPQSESDS